MINGKVEEKSCWRGPNLLNIFEDDVNLKETLRKIMKTLDDSFMAAENYASTFQKYLKFYGENEATDLSALQEKELGKIC